MPLGYIGRILRVDLSTNSISLEEPNEIFYRRYLGGRGLIGYYLLKEVPQGTDPLGPDNLLVFSAGPLTGTPIPGAGRHSVGAKSPLTGGYGEAEAGGYFGAELKRAGFDAIIIRGRSPKPVYLWVNDGHAEIRDASGLWGTTTGQCQAAIREQLADDHIIVSSIGPAGERLLKIACIINDMRCAAGRCGLGAVMGSKQLKAVAVRGHERPEVAERGIVKELARFVHDSISTIKKDLYENGTSGGVVGLNEVSSFPTRNFQQGQFELADNLSGETMSQTILVRRDTCYACPIRCKRVVKTEEPFATDPSYGGPEYETVAALGANCGVGDLAAVALGNQLCNAYGLDTIGTGSAIAFAMECAQRGLLPGPEQPTFGDAQAMLSLVEDITYRRGLGDLLADGAYHAAQRIGSDSLAYVMHVKGQDFPMHEPRLKMGLGLGYAMSVTGADHNHNIHDTSFMNAAALGNYRPLGILEPLPLDDLGPGKVRIVIYGTLLNSLNNHLHMCLFQPYSPLQKVDMVNAVTGWNVSLWELMKVSERGMALARIFAAREGLVGREWDQLPPRAFEPFTSGPLTGVAIDRIDFENARSTYYAMLGWDEQGVPTPEKLAELDIGWAGQQV